MFDDIVTIINKYTVVRAVAGEDWWPNDFPLQDVIDFRSVAAEAAEDGLPVSADVAEREALENKDLRYRMPEAPNITFELVTETEAENIP